jgi:hypothetical protein
MPAQLYIRCTQGRQRGICYPHAAPHCQGLVLRDKSGSIGDQSANFPVQICVAPDALHSEGPVLHR